MKTCSVCGLEYENQYSFCPEDGVTLINMEETGSPSAQIASAEPAPSLERDNPAKEDSTTGLGPRVLYCPACAGEYPLTFTVCPVDGARLNAQKTAATVAAPVRTLPLKIEKAPAPSVEPRPSIQPEAFPAAARRVAEPAHSASITTPLEAEKTAPAFAYGSSDKLFGSVASAKPGPAPARQRFNRINLALMVALALVLIAAAYAVATGSRDAAQLVTPADRTAVEAQTKPSLFVETPQTASQYSEPVETAPPDEQAEDVGYPVQPRSFYAPKPRTQREPTEKRQPRPAIVERPLEQTRPRQVTASGQTQPRIVQAVDRRVNANLIRVRSRSTQSGYRYELTFTLHDPAGRSFYWEKLLVTTRSASGIVRDQVIAFRHRQGANGLLTFTVAVDLNGATEADWRGSVVCTSLGTDGPGSIMKAGFTANLAPW